MADIFTDIHNPDATRQVIEENVAEFLLAMGRAGGGEEHRTPQIQWTIGGSPVSYHNAVVRADLSSHQADAAIQAFIGRLRAYRLPGSWHVAPGMQPDDLAERLARLSFHDGGPEPAMAADLLHLDPTSSGPDELVIERVQNSRALDEWMITLAQGFGEREAKWAREVYARIGLDDAVPWRHFLGKIGARPVATATLFLSSGVGGLYFVSTVPEMRRKGIGLAITRQAMQTAKDMGYRVAVLGSSEMGLRLYQSLGFREYFRYRIMEWQYNG